MPGTQQQTVGKVALITGAARRIGASVARALHERGWNVILHHRSSAAEARALCEQLNRTRPDSARTAAADLRDITQLRELAQQASSAWGRLDALINNASAFYPTQVSTTTPEQWDELLDSNLKGPYFLSQATLPLLERAGGSIVNIVDVHAERPLREHSVYSISKAGLAMMTRALARELGPRIRVNGVSPGAILWPERGMDDDKRESILARTALKRPGEPADIARAVLFLLDAPYVTGQIIAVDGGRSLYS
ncbi:MAG: pteridine reductase [Gammaproteobacteria bacterium]|jgi:pteridine reductase|nr:pteridine reductase [Gammaproteobacteria bacterium]